MTGVVDSIKNSVAHHTVHVGLCRSLKNLRALVPLLLWVVGTLSTLKHATSLLVALRRSA